MIERITPIGIACTSDTRKIVVLENTGNWCAKIRDFAVQESLTFDRVVSAQQIPDTFGEITLVLLECNSQNLLPVAECLAPYLYLPRLACWVISNELDDSQIKAILQLGFFGTLRSLSDFPRWALTAKRFLATVSPVA